MPRLVYDDYLRSVLLAIDSKSSLSFWRSKISLPLLSSLYPSSLPSHLRLAIKLRSQLITKTYLTQRRLFILGKSRDDTCKLCSLAVEDTIHFLAACPVLISYCLAFLNRVRALGLPPCVIRAFDRDDPETLAVNILFPLAYLSASDSSQLVSLCLQYILKICNVRTHYM